MAVLHPPNIEIVPILDENGKMVKRDPIRQIKMVDLKEDLLVFDSDNLLNDPRPRFKELSIGDFDLYCATAYCLSRSECSAHIWTEIKANRITRDFRLRVFGTIEGVTYPAISSSGNFWQIEILFDMLNEMFHLIDGHTLSTEEMRHAKYAIEDALSRLRRIINFPFEEELFCQLDVGLVLHKMLPRGESYSYWDDWFRRKVRGMKGYATWHHPELLQ